MKFFKDEHYIFISTTVVWQQWNVRYLDDFYLCSSCKASAMRRCKLASHRLTLSIGFTSVTSGLCLCNVSPISLSVPVDVLLQVFRSLRQLNKRSQEHNPTGSVNNNCSTVDIFGNIFTAAVNWVTRFFSAELYPISPAWAVRLLRLAVQNENAFPKPEDFTDLDFWHWRVCIIAGCWLKTMRSEESLCG